MLGDNRRHDILLDRSTDHQHNVLLDGSTDHHDHNVLIDHGHNCPVAEDRCCAGW
jgi:hypothetical protein